MKSLMNNKKFIIYVSAVLIILMIIGSILLFGKGNKKSETTTEVKSIINNYVAYIKINPSIKLEYTSTCKESDLNNVLECEEPTVTKYELINEDAKNIYKDINLLGSSKDLFKVLNLICETAKDNGIVFEKVNIYTDWNEIESYINEKKEISDTITFNIEITNTDDVNKKIETEENNIINYNVSFDTNGGNKVERQVVKKNEKAIKPINPTKKGYKFVEWQLDNKTFDFDTVITKDIILKAKWEKEENKPTTNNTQNNNNNNNNNNASDNKNTETNNNSSNSNVNDGTSSNENKEQGVNNPPEEYECYDEENGICATNLTKKQNLLACAKQLKDIKDKQVNWTNSHNEYPLITDLPALSSYNLLSVHLDPDKFDCTTSNGWGKCYGYILRCKSSDDIYNELNVSVYFKDAD